MLTSKPAEHPMPKEPAATIINDFASKPTEPALKSSPKRVEVENLADELAQKDYDIDNKVGKEEELIDIQALPSFMSARSGYDPQPYSHFSVISQENEKIEEFDQKRLSEQLVIKLKKIEIERDEDVGKAFKVPPV